VWWLRRGKRLQRPTLLDPDLFRSKPFRLGISSQLLQQIALGGLMIALVLEYNALEAGISIAPLSLSMFAIALLAGRRAGDRRPSTIIRAGFAVLTIGIVVLIPLVPDAESGWRLAIPLTIAGCGLGLLVSQLNNYTLAPITEDRVSEAAGVNSACGSFGLSFGLAFAGAILLASLSYFFTDLSDDSAVLPQDDKEQIAEVLDEDAEVMTNTGLEELLVEEPEDVQDEVIRINTEARPEALQVALVIPLLAALLGLVNGIRMVRTPEPQPSGAAEGMLLG
jgi:hypothetical protein